MRRRPPPTSALLVYALVVLGGLAAGAAPPASALTTWIRPVLGRVVRPFAPPLTRYGRGHLGVDFAAAPGTPVRAAGPGIVVFAGAVGPTTHVVVRHAGGLRTSYSFLSGVSVRRGDRVARGRVLGTTGGRGEHHDGRVLHFGLRIGTAYVDPMQLFAPTDLSALVHLVSDGAPLARGPAGEAESVVGARDELPAEPVRTPTGVGADPGVAAVRAGPPAVAVCYHRAPRRPSVGGGRPIHPG